MQKLKLTKYHHSLCLTKSRQLFGKTCKHKTSQLPLWNQSALNIFRYVVVCFQHRCQPTPADNFK